MIDDATLNEIDARAAAATEGPWSAVNEDGYHVTNGTGRYAYKVTGVDGESGDGLMDREDAIFVAHARTDIPALVAEVRLLKLNEALLVVEAQRLHAEVKRQKDVITGLTEGFKYNEGDHR